MPSPKRDPQKPGDNRKTGAPTGRPGKAPQGNAHTNRKSNPPNPRESNYGQGKGKGPNK